MNESHHSERDLIRALVQEVKRLRGRYEACAGCGDGSGIVTGGIHDGEDCPECAPPLCRDLPGCDGDDPPCDGCIQPFRPERGAE